MTFRGQEIGTAPEHVERSPTAKMRVEKNWVMHPLFTNTEKLDSRPPRQEFIELSSPV